MHLQSREKRVIAGNMMVLSLTAPSKFHQSAVQPLYHQVHQNTPHILVQNVLIIWFQIGGGPKTISPKNRQQFSEFCCLFRVRQWD